MGRSSSTSSQRSRSCFALAGGVVEVGVVEEGGEVVFLAAHAQALEVDEPDLVVLDEEVLGLEVAVDEVGVGGAEAVAQGFQGLVLAEGDGRPFRGGSPRSAR